MQYYNQREEKMKKEAKLKKMASDVDWNKVTGKDWVGDKYTFSLNADGSVHVICGEDIDADYDAEDILEEVDIFDAQGNMISNHRDYK